MKHVLVTRVHLFIPRSRCRVCMLTQIFHRPGHGRGSVSKFRTPFYRHTSAAEHTSHTRRSLLKNWKKSAVRKQRGNGAKKGTWPPQEGKVDINKRQTAIISAAPCSHQQTTSSFLFVRCQTLHLWHTHVVTFRAERRTSLVPSKLGKLPTQVQSWRKRHRSP